MRKWVSGTNPVITGIGLIASLLGMFFVWNAGYAQSAAAGSIFPVSPLKHLMFAVAGVGLHFWISKKDPSWIKKRINIAFSICVLLLGAIFVVGKDIKGATRWLGYGPVSLQPSELAKVFAVVAMACGVSKAIEVLRSPHVSEARKSKAYTYWLTSFIGVLICAGMVALQPDLDTAVIIGLIGFSAMFVGGVNWKVIGLVVLIGASGLGYYAGRAAYRSDRISSHFGARDLAYERGSGFQPQKSVEAIDRGGLTGIGFTQGNAKKNLPMVTSDFVMTTVGEELGFIGFLMSFGLVSWLVGALLMQVKQMSTPFAKLVLTGMATWIGVQAGVNVLVANGSLPVMGFPMPFYSEGGTSLLALWLGLGVCQSVIRAESKCQTSEDVVETGGYGWRNRRSHLSGA